MDEKTAIKRDDALTFLVNHITGVLSTISKEGASHSRLLYYTCDDDFNIYFITLANTRKVQDIAHNPNGSFVVFETEFPRTIQLEGTIEDLTYSATIDPQIESLLHTLQSNKKYGPPLARFDADEVKFYRLSPNWIRWGDFTFGRGSDQVFTEVPSTEV